MSTTSSANAADGSQSQVHPCTTQSQEEPVPANGSDSFRIMLSMGLSLSQARASTWAKTLCEAVSSLKKMKAGFWSHVLVAIPLLIAILTLWPTFIGTAETEKATELAKWTARKDFLEFCQSFNWEPAGCDVHPDSLGPPPVLRRQQASWSSNTRTGSAFNSITLAALSFGIFCLLLKIQQRRLRSMFQASFHSLTRHRHGRRILSIPLFPVQKASDAEETLKSTSIAHSTGFETTDRVPRRRLVGNDSRPRLQNTLEAYDRTEDDNDIKMRPDRHVDYLTHVWQEEDLHQSWRHVQSQKTNYKNAARLENAAWRSWTKFRHDLPTISPIDINWSKDDDVTWLYGPLQPQPVELYKLTNNIDDNKREWAQKVDIIKRTATSKTEKGNQNVAINEQLGLDESVTKTFLPKLQQGGNLRHGRHFSKPSTEKHFTKAKPKEVHFKE